MNMLWKDLRYGLRMLLKNPGFTAVTVLTLALGIGANTAIFSVVNAVLLRPLPYEEPDRLVTLWERSPRRGLERALVSPPNYMEWREQNRVFENMTFFGGGDFNLVTADGVEKVKCTYASSSLFPVMRVNPLLGRTLLPEEDQHEGNRVAIISYELWQRRFGGDAKVLGQTLTVDTYGRRDYLVVGVMPPGFRVPNQCELWLPAGWNGIPTNRRGGHWLQVIARLKAGVTLEQAQTEMNAIQARIEQQNPNVIIGSHVDVVPLLEQTLGRNLRLALLILWGVVSCVLLIACANVANLLLAHSAARQKEIALRLALGASRWRIIGQLFTESLLLAMLGGALGVLLTLWSLNLFVAIGANHIPRLQEVGVDGGSLLFTLLISLATSVLFGLAPAWKFSKPDLNEALKEGTRGATIGLRRSRFRGVLVASEIAISSVLLIGSGLMTKSFVQLMRINRGFQPDHLLTAQLDFSVSGFTTWVRRTSTRPQVTLKELMARIGSQPDVQSVGAVSVLPMTIGSARIQTFVIENKPLLASGEKLTANFQGVTSEFFRTMGIPLLQGHSFTEGDVFEAPSVFIINEAMAKRYFPGENPIGRRMAMGGRTSGQVVGPNPSASSPWGEIVGVVGDMRKLNLSAETVPDVYAPYWQWPMQTPTLLVRTVGNPANIAAAIRSEVKSANNNLPAPVIRTMDEILADTVAQPRFHTVLSGLFGVVALVLAAVGIYGVMAYVVAQRTHEIGIRMSLGAEKGDVLRLIVRQGMALVSIGLVAGIAGAVALTRVLSNLLYEVKPIDPPTFMGVVLLLASVALLACYIPARRAAKVDPMVALRYE